jgi:hypothetical protein
VTKQLKGAVDEHPPEVRWFALVPKVDAGFDEDLGARFDEVGKLLVAEALEETDSPELTRVHQTVPR